MENTPASPLTVRSFSDIAKVDILSDSNTVIQTSTASAIGRGLVGQLLFGAAGAVVGGSTASKRLVTTSRYTVRVVFKDIRNPSLTVDFGQDLQSANRAYAFFTAMSQEDVSPLPPAFA